MQWLDKLKQIVEKNPIVVLRFNGDEWESLLNSRNGPREFTIARSHEQLMGAKPLTPCLIIGKSDYDEHIYLGLISSKSAISTLESRIKIKRGNQIVPRTKPELFSLIQNKTHSTNLIKRFETINSVISLSPKLSSYLIDRLASIQDNHGPMRNVIATINAPTHYSSNIALQDDAVQVAFKAFGLESGEYALSLELVEGRESAMGRVPIMEDSVIEHDARSIPGYDLVGSDLTGRAVFERDGERLEVFTANRRPLERVFGVDLIYQNLSKQNIVMLQYKMLEEKNLSDTDTDWIYRPDSSLEEELRRMKLFATGHDPNHQEYRLNSSVFYLKFVKRDKSVNSGSVIIPIDHFERLREDPACIGPRGGWRISYESLSGRYLRETPFLDLIRAGYIGAYAETTVQLRTLVNAVLDNDRSIVAAIQQSTSNKIIKE